MIDVVKIVMDIIFFSILIICSIYDIKTGIIPIRYSVIGYILKSMELIFIEPEILKMNMFLSLITAVLMFSISYIGNLGGADVLIGILCTLNLSVNGLWGLVLSFAFAIPYTLKMKIDNNEHEYPFIPYITAGMVVITILKGAMI